MTTPHASSAHDLTLPGGLDHSRMQRLLGYNLAQAAIPTSKIFSKHVGVPHDLRQVEFTVLVLVDSNGDVTQKQLAQSLGLSAPNLTVVLDKLVRRELIVRERSESDRRHQFVRLTRKGTVLLRKAEAASAHMEQEWMAKLTAGERIMLFELLMKLAARRKV